MKYDLYVIYYGNNDTNYAKYKDCVKFIEKRKGSKFQNFKYFYDKYPDVIKQYDYFFILDDDITINVAGINKMFEIAQSYKLSICGPSFLPGSKISHDVTKHNPALKLAYTNFVEVNTPLFSKAALEKLMKVLPPELIGWGIDYLYIWLNGVNKKKDYAIVHCVKCMNPKDEAKPIKRRELTLITNCPTRSTIWKAFATKIGCPAQISHIEYEKIPIHAMS